ncbi:MAG: acetyl-CoA carboxylase carboxyltransferase subunit alpha [Chloroflexi bacterium]|nr:acetyl-CoA carboxylase carboxyltransferase subunit alpha [Chloroflexota bacterium]
MAVLSFEKDLDKLRGEIDKVKESGTSDGGGAGRLADLEDKLEQSTLQVFSALSAWDRVQLARHPDRPHTLDYIDHIFSDFIELHGDRHFGDDAAIVGGPAKFNGQRVMVVGHQKGRGTRDSVKRNFGMASPEGFRKGLRLMRQAEKFGLPVITFVDIPGASPVLEAEERGQAWAIADNLLGMIELRVPIIVAVTGEGGSGGALALGIGDRVLIQEYGVYSVASPQGCASIVWRDHKFAPEAAEALKLTPTDLLKLGVVDRIVREPLGGAHRDYARAAEILAEDIGEELNAVSKISTDELIAGRYRKYREMGRDVVDILATNESNAEPRPKVREGKSR